MYICTQNAQSWDIITKNEMTMIAAKKYNPNFNYGDSPQFETMSVIVGVFY